MEVVKGLKKEWKHPIATNLARQYNYEKDLVEIIETISEDLLNQLRAESPKIFPTNLVYVPVEQIISSLQIDFVKTSGDDFAGQVQNQGSNLQISASYSSKTNYFRRRFSIAHELGHIILRKLVSPLTNNEVIDAYKFHYEEEALCNLFAASLLTPKQSIIQYLQNSDEITSSIVDRIAGDFRVNRESVLRRIAQLTNSILLLWKKTNNPLTKGSPRAERVIRIYPNSSQLSSFYIPLYCTLNDSRFSPNLIQESLSEGISKSGIIRISQLGSLPEGHYKIHNILFKKSSKNLPAIREENKNPYDMATLIELKDLADVRF
jgi:Zn-dependent peptidase ImmA (M78 family)